MVEITTMRLDLAKNIFQIHGIDPRGNAPSIPEYEALVHPDDRLFVAQVIQKLLADRCAFDFTKRIVRPDGSLRHVRCVGVPTADGSFGEADNSRVSTVGAPHTTTTSLV